MPGRFPRGLSQMKPEALVKRAPFRHRQIEGQRADRNCVGWVGGRWVRSPVGAGYCGPGRHPYTPGPHTLMDVMVPIDSLYRILYQDGRGNTITIGGSAVGSAIDLRQSAENVKRKCAVRCRQRRAWLCAWQRGGVKSNDPPSCQILLECIFKGMLDPSCGFWYL